ncbi:hypothetical protein ACN08P_23055 (plasmid) [Photobacterium leiognathi subsp. mandapamensis]|uniref:hypothetical protein n=1 Tax=Photobacterium leiognathi TaxID=553611 RepID=UPI003AF3CDF9
MKFKYANEHKDTVLVTDTDLNMTVPRGHRFWEEYGISKAEKMNQIEAYQTPAELDAIERADKLSKATSELAKVNSKLVDVLIDKLAVTKDQLSLVTEKQVPILLSYRKKLHDFINLEAATFPLKPKGLEL